MNRDMNDKDLVLFALGSPFSFKEAKEIVKLLPEGQRDFGTVDDLFKKMYQENFSFQDLAKLVTQRYSKFNPQPEPPQQQ